MSDENLTQEKVEKAESTEHRESAPVDKKRFFKHKQKRKVCIFCEDRNHKQIDYKDINKIKKFVTEKGKILPRRQTGTCASHQRELTTAIKRAKMMAYLPFKGE